MSDIATPGPIDPNSGQPDRQAEVSALKTWLRQNTVSLVITAGVIGLILWKLDPIDTLKVILGLGLVIFIHELGHFLAAKWCDVHVKTFSIGFGPAVPFCSYKWGETTYMVGIIPLGGYVSMVGEGQAGENSPEYEPEDEESDPRSFRRKTVGQRMLIISAGVIMNVILGMACFVAAYLHGVKEQPAAAGTVVSGSAAWKAGMRTGDDIIRIGSRDEPVFKDIRPIVMSTVKGEKVTVVVRHADGTEETLEVEPQRDEGAYYPQIGVSPPARLELVSVAKKKSFRPVYPGTPAAAAKDPGFEQGDRIVAMTDPATGQVTDLPPDPKSPGQRQPDFREFQRRMALLAGKPVTFQVVRKGQPDHERVSVTVAPAYRSDLGVRMLMGEIVAVRAGSAAAKAGVVARSEETSTRGDKIAAVGVTLPGETKKTWFANGKLPEEAAPGDALRPLDPILLPHELAKWAAAFPDDERKKGLPVELVVLREAGHTTRRVPLTLTYDDSYRFDREPVGLPNSPLAVSGLGLAYWVEAVVSEVDPNGPAAGKVKDGDVVETVRLKAADADGNVKPGEWEEIKSHQWASTEAAFQRSPPHEIDLRLKRGGETVEVTLQGKADANWPVEDRGLIFQDDQRIHQATSVGHAISLGAHATVRFIRSVYLNLYAMIFGRVSAKTMSGPLTIATVSYRFAGEDFWQFLLFLGMISVNLAVVNFLPIPVLDGGHMVFLILEKVLGRPVPDRLFTWAMGIGLVMILTLMGFVIYQDIRRLFFGWF